MDSEFDDQHQHDSTISPETVETEPALSPEDELAEGARMYILRVVGTFAGLLSEEEMDLNSTSTEEEVSAFSSPFADSDNEDEYELQDGECDNELVSMLRSRFRKETSNKESWVSKLFNTSFSESSFPLFSRESGLTLSQRAQLWFLLQSTGEYMADLIKTHLQTVQTNHRLEEDIQNHQNSMTTVDANGNLLPQGNCQLCVHLGALCNKYRARTHSLLMLNQEANERVRVSQQEHESAQRLLNVETVQLKQKLVDMQNEYNSLSSRMKRLEAQLAKEKENNELMHQQKLHAVHELDDWRTRVEGYDEERGASVREITRLKSLIRAMKVQGGDFSDADDDGDKLGKMRSVSLTPAGKLGKNDDSDSESIPIDEFQSWLTEEVQKIQQITPNFLENIDENGNITHLSGSEVDFPDQSDIPVEVTEACRSLEDILHNLTRTVEALPTSALNPSVTNNAAAARGTGPLAARDSAVSGLEPGSLSCASTLVLATQAAETGNPLKSSVSIPGSTVASATNTSTAADMYSSSAASLTSPSFDSASYRGASRRSEGSEQLPAPSAALLAGDDEDNALVVDFSDPSGDLHGDAHAVAEAGLGLSASEKQLAVNGNARSIKKQPPVLQVLPDSSDSGKIFVEDIPDPLIASSSPQAATALSNGLAETNMQPSVPGTVSSNNRTMTTSTVTNPQLPPTTSSGAHVTTHGGAQLVPVHVSPAQAHACLASHTPTDGDNVMVVPLPFEHLSQKLTEIQSDYTDRIRSAMIEIEKLRRENTRNAKNINLQALKNHVFKKKLASEREKNRKTQEDILTLEHRLRLMETHRERDKLKFEALQKLSNQWKAKFEDAQRKLETAQSFVQNMSPAEMMREQRKKESSIAKDATQALMSKMISNGLQKGQKSNSEQPKTNAPGTDSS